MSEVEAERKRIERRREECLLGLGRLHKKWASEIVALLRQSSLGNRYIFRDWQDDYEGRLSFYLKLIKCDDYYDLFKDDDHLHGFHGVTMTISSNYWNPSLSYSISVLGYPDHFDDRVRISYTPDQNEDDQIRSLIVTWLARDSTQP